MEHTLAVSAMSWSRFLGVKSRVGDVGGGRRISSRRGLRFCFAVAMASSILPHSPWAFGFAWKEVRPQRTAPPCSDSVPRAGSRPDTDPASVSLSPWPLQSCSIPHGPSDPCGRRCARNAQRHHARTLAEVGRQIQNCLSFSICKCSYIYVLQPATKT
jgi:hypothetical protein